MVFKLFNLFKKEQKQAVITDYINAGSSVYHAPSGHVYMYSNASIQTIINNYNQIAPLNTGLSKLARSMANVPIALFDKDTEERVKNHPILSLLAHPNSDDQKVYTDLARDFVKWRILDGNAYFMITGSSKPLELYSIPPIYISPQVDNRGYIGEYRYDTSYGSTIFRRNSKDKFVSDDGMQELFAVSNFHPMKGSNQLEGMSEIQALYYEINQYLFACQHNLSLLENGARPSGAFVVSNASGTPQVLSDIQFDRIKKQVEESYSGSINSGRPLILEGGLQFHEMSINPKDMDFVKLKEHAEQKIYNCLDIPLSLIMDVKLTANNMSEVKLEFYQSRVIPLASYFLSYLNNSVLPRYKGYEGVELRVDEDKVDVLIPVIQMRRKVIEDSPVMMINEKRKALNLPIISGGDVIVDPNGRHVAGPDALLTVGELGQPKAKDPENQNDDEPEGDE